MHEAAALTEDIAELARQRRTDDAALLASALSHAATLQDLFKLRDWYLVLPGEDWSTGIWDARTWCNPWDVQLHVLVGVGGGAGVWEELREGIRKGGTLWYPSIQQAHAASGPHQPNNDPDPINPRRDGAIFVG